MKLAKGKKEKNPLALAVEETATRLEAVIILLNDQRKALNSLVVKKHELYDRRLRQLQECEDRLSMRIPKLFATLVPLSEATRVAFDSLRTTVQLYIERNEKALIMQALELHEQAAELCHQWSARSNPHMVDMLTSFEREWERALLLPGERKYVVVRDDADMFAPPFLTLEEAANHVTFRPGIIRDVSGLKLVNGRLTGLQADKGPHVSLQRLQPVDRRQ